MLEIFKKVRSLLSQRERRQASMLFLLMLLAAAVEVMGVASVMPFVAVLANPQAVESNPYLAQVYQWLGFEQPRSFMMFMGAAVLLVFVSSLALKALNTFAIQRFSSLRIHSLSSRLLAGYMARPYTFFLARNTADLAKTLFSEVGEVVNGVLLPALKMVSGSVVAAAVIVLLFMVEPQLTLVVGGVLGGGFLMVYWSSRKVLKRLGARRGQANKSRFTLANEALGGNKELRLLGREADYLRRFDGASQDFARFLAASKALGEVPQYAIQAIAFGGVLLLVLYLMGRYGGLQEAMPLIALYAFAGYRLLPAFQEIFKNSTQLRFYHAALDSLHADLVGAPTELGLKERSEREQTLHRLSGAIEVERLRFRYPGAERWIIDDLSFGIQPGACVAFVGSTGAGKSTVVDLLLGLLTPDEGQIRIAGHPLQGEALTRWQRSIGYVPQSIYLADASVAENIAFGVPAELIDHAAVERAARAAHLHDFIVDQLPEGYLTAVGERGVRLSGGQRQRIGIARALYHEPDVVVFDEATSALDNATEAAVMEAVNDLAGQKTIIMIAHRLSTVRRCDVIFLLEQGRLSEAGTYDELVANNEVFGRMAAGKA